ncbi:MAG: TonB-dependent receptor domain-containing protein [Methylobacter sp.]
MPKRNMRLKKANTTTIAKWRLVALLPLGAALSSMALAADADTNKKTADKKEVTLPTVEVIDRHTGSYFAGGPRFSAATNVLPFGSEPDLDIFNPVYGKTVPAASPYQNDAMSQDQVGLYLQDQIKFTEKLRTARPITGSPVPRSSQSDSEPTDRAGLVYLADNDLAPYFFYAQSFLPALGTDANTKRAFKPETGEQYEFGVKFQPKHQNSFITLAYFDLTRQNYLTLDSITFANVQKGEAHSRGVELEGVAVSITA